MINRIFKAITGNGISLRLMQLIFLIGTTTWIHHIYGGIVYDTPYRIVVPSITIPLLLLTTFYLQYKLICTASSTMKFAYIFIVSVFWIVSVGIIEGGYNHVLKNILFFSGVSQEKLATFFPPEFGSLRLFEQPNDTIFEVTGIAQFFIGLMIAYYLRRLIVTLRLN